MHEKYEAKITKYTELHVSEKGKIQTETKQLDKYL